MYKRQSLFYYDLWNEYSDMEVRKNQEIRATVVVLPSGAIHLCTTSKMEYSAGCPAFYLELTEKKRITWYCLQVVTMEKYSCLLYTSR